ncbi:hypothetical protein DASC09_051630 [Saccharomycopsis crataegensis]|uniref:Glutathione peroxidase n=1 Tax=Saccharomycopsis crataegensis TaxID=43959 RepID=A0AAV5QSN6_9ASCO|nr:hypothetical protein DASC09_051630 [Saccharomycopsis crataegensis]
MTSIYSCTSDTDNLFNDEMSWTQETTDSFIDDDLEFYGSINKRSSMCYFTRPAILRVSVNSFEDLSDIEDGRVPETFFQKTKSQEDAYNHFNFESFPNNAHYLHPNVEISSTNQHQNVHSPPGSISDRSSSIGSSASESHDFNIPCVSTVTTSSDSQSCLSACKSRESKSQSTSLKSAKSLWRSIPRITSNFVANNIIAPPPPPTDKLFDEYYSVRATTNKHNQHNPYINTSARLSSEASEISIPSELLKAHEGDFYSLSASLYDTTPFEFTQLQGKVVLIVNISTSYGLSHQLRKYSKLYKRFNPKKFQILAFMSSEFLQEPSRNHPENEKSLYRAPHPIMATVNVNGSNCHPVFKFLKTSKAPAWINKFNVNNGNYGVGEDGCFSKRLLWNYEKFLIDSNGTVVRRFHPLVGTHAIEKYIKELI